MLEKLKEALKLFASENGLEKVFYGMASDRSGTMKWNYIILKRARNARSGKSSNDSTEYYTITLVHEDYIPEGMAEDLVKSVLSRVSGLRLAGDIEYDYGFKNSTDLVVEAAFITFCRARKGCSVWQD